MSAKESAKSRLLSVLMLKYFHIRQNVVYGAKKLY